jgi:hypothetical protein
MYRTVSSGGVLWPMAEDGCAEKRDGREAKKVPLTPKIRVQRA